MGDYAQTRGWLMRQAELFLPCQVPFWFSVYVAGEPELSLPAKGRVTAY